MKNFGFGAMRLPVLDKEDGTKVDLEQVNKMADAFLEAGFTYFDTAYMYHGGFSERAMKSCVIERHDRSSFTLADKMPIMHVHGPEDYPKFFDEQLSRTGAGYFDYYLLHAMNAQRYEECMKWGAFDFVAEKKKQGLIKHAGFSFHDSADVLDKILTEHPEVEFVQLQLNYLDWDSAVVQSGACYEVAVNHNVPIVVMEPVKGGTLANLPEGAVKLLKENGMNDSPATYALRFCMSLPGVMVVLSGMSNMEQALDNCQTLKDCEPLTAEEKQTLAKVANIINSGYVIPCTRCGYCMEVCPIGMPIPSLMGLYNNFAVSGNMSKNYLARITYGHNVPSACLGCQACEGNCPQHIEITKYLNEIAKYE